MAMLFNSSKEYGRITHSSSLQALKGFAALMVFFSHGLLMYLNETIILLQNSPFHFFFDGQCAVVIFFCLTGFFSYKEENFTIAIYISILKNKVFRIYPAYILVTIIGWLIANLDWQYNKSLFTEWSNQFWQEKLSFSHLIKALSLVIPFDTTLLNPSVWYIQVDMRMALLLPVVFFLLYKLNRFKIPILLIMIGVFVAIKPPYGMMFFPYYGGGIFLKILVIYYKDKLKVYYEGINKWILLIISLLFIDCFNITGLAGVIAFWWMPIIQIIGSVIIVGFFYFTNLSWFTRVFLNIGNISYEIYLIHFIILLALRPLSLSVIMYLIIAFSVTILFAYLLERYLTRPVRLYYKSKITL